MTDNEQHNEFVNYIILYLLGLYVSWLIYCWFYSRVWKSWEFSHLKKKSTINKSQPISNYPSDFVWFSTQWDKSQVRITTNVLKSWVLCLGVVPHVLVEWCSFEKWRKMALWLLSARHALRDGLCVRRFRTCDSLNIESHRIMSSKIKFPQACCSASCSTTVWNACSAVDVKILQTLIPSCDSFRQGKMTRAVPMGTISVWAKFPRVSSAKTDLLNRVNG
jgi:hypothetical protein